MWKSSDIRVWKWEPRFKIQLHLPSMQCLSFQPGDESLVLATLDKTVMMLKALLHFLTCFFLCFCFPNEISFASTITWWHTGLASRAIFIPGVMPDTSTPCSAHRALTHGRHQAGSTGWEADIRSEPPPCPGSLTGRPQYVQQAEGGGCQQSCLWGRRHCHGEAGLYSECDWANDTVNFK